MEFAKQWKPLIIFDSLIEFHPGSEKLANRGTKEAHRQICRIQETLPDQRIEYLSKSAEELTRRNSWRPLSPSDLLTLVSEAESGRADDQVKQVKADSEDGIESVFRKAGAVWTLSFERKTIHLPDRVGLGHIANLLRTPQVAIEAAQLAGMSFESSKLMPMPGIPLSNEATIKAVRVELGEKKTALAGLHERDWSRKGALKDDISKLEEYLGKVENLHAHARKVAGTAERARTRVTNAINRAIEHISKQHPVLGGHLQESIETGTAPVYDPTELPDWQF